MDLLISMRAFILTVDSGSMTAAATRLDITPAMVGQHIASLERRLGTRLLNRTTRRQNLTEFGRHYLEQCRDIIGRVALADRSAEIETGLAQGTLRITAPITFGSTLLIPMLNAYYQTYPNVEVDLTLCDRNVDLIEEGIDIAFRIGELQDGRMIQRPLLPYKMTVSASPQYLKKKGIPEQPSDLSEHEFILFSANTKREFFFTRREETVRVSPHYRLSVNHSFAVLQAAREGIGLTIQPYMLIEQDLKEGKLVQLLEDWELGERFVSLLYYRDQLMTPKLRSFIDMAYHFWRK
jgi:DNA-binding transcriptional LysR family regulator